LGNVQVGTEATYTIGYLLSNTMPDDQTWFADWRAEIEALVSDATDAADAAAISETNSADSETAAAASQASATASATSASDSATLAGGYATAAQTAQDVTVAAAAAQGYFDTTAAGLAAVAIGEEFYAPVTGGIGLYTKVSAGVATLLHTISSDTTTKALIAARLAVGGVIALFGPTGTTAIAATTSGLTNDITWISGSMVQLVMPGANGASPTLAINGGAAISITDNDGAALAAGALPSGRCVTLRYSSSGPQWRVMTAGATAAEAVTNRASATTLTALASEGYRQRGTITSATALSTCVLPGAYRGLSNGSYTVVPPGLDLTKSFDLTVDAAGGTTGTGAGTYVTQTIVSNGIIGSGAYAYRQTFQRRVTLASPTDVSGFNAWFDLSPSAAIRDEVMSQRGTLTSGTDIATIWAPGMYVGLSGSTFTNLPPDMAAGVFTLEVTNPGDTDGIGGLYRFSRQVIRRLAMTNNALPTAYLPTWQRIVDSSNPSVTTGLYAWTRLDVSANRPFIGQNIVCFGDSITQGDNTYEWVTSFATMTGATVTNGGFGGCRMAQDTSSTNKDALAMYNLATYAASGDFSAATTAALALQAVDSNTLRPAHAAALDALDWSAVDYAMIWFGTNDFTAATPLGSAGDTTAATFKGGINLTIETLLTAYPTLNLVFLTPMWRSRVYTAGDDSNLTPNTSGVYLREYVDAVIERAQAHQIPVIDMYYSCGINMFNEATLLDDGLHPVTADGIAHIARKIFTLFSAVA
jgi:lysophospholipase L1-like esterase